MKHIIIFLLLLSLDHLLLADDETLKFPSDVIGYIASQHPQKIIDELDFISNFLQIPTEKAKELTTTVLFKNPHLDSFALEKPFMYLFLDPIKYKTPFCFMIHLRDQQLFFKHFGQGLLGEVAFKKSDQKGPLGIEIYLEERTRFDRKAFLAALKKGDKITVDKFQSVEIQEYYIYQESSKIWVSGDQQFLEKMIKQPHLTEFILNSNEGLKLAFLPHLFWKNIRQSFGILSTIIEKEFFTITLTQKIEKISIHLILRDDSLDFHFQMKPKRDANLQSYFQDNIGKLIEKNASQVREIFPFQINKNNQNNNYQLQLSSLQSQLPFDLNYRFLEGSHIFSMQENIPAHVKRAEETISIYFHILKNPVLNWLKGLQEKSNAAIEA